MDLDYFKNRTTIRNFEKKEISDQLITKILEYAIKAPTCGNMQLYSVIITRESEKKKNLAIFHYNQAAAISADVILTICADFNRFSKWCKVKKAVPGYSNFHSFMMAMTDAVILTQQIVTISELMGIGTCYLGTVNYNATEISDLLKLPDLVIPVASLAMGYFNPQEKEETERLSVGSVLHNEYYKQYSDKDLIDSFKIKEEFLPNKRYIEENNKRNLAEVFTEIRYPKDMNEKVSCDFLELLKKKKFL